jgi:hypothetical protein
MIDAKAQVTVGIMDDKLFIEVGRQCPWDKPRYHSVLVSRNGYQWSGFTCHSIEELVGVRDAIDSYLGEVQE